MTTRRFTEELAYTLDLYCAGYNEPGYLPDSDEGPATFATFDEARRAIITEIKRSEDIRGDEGDESAAEELASLAEDVNLESSPFDVVGADGLAYWVMRRTACDLAEELAETIRNGNRTAGRDALRALAVVHPSLALAVAVRLTDKMAGTETVEYASFLRLMTDDGEA